MKFTVAMGFGLDKKIPMVIEKLSEKYKIEYKNTVCEFTKLMHDVVVHKDEECEGVFKVYDRAKGMDKEIDTLDQADIMNIF